MTTGKRPTGLQGLGEPLYLHQLLFQKIPKTLYMIVMQIIQALPRLQCQPNLSNFNTIVSKSYSKFFYVQTVVSCKFK